MPIRPENRARYPRDWKQISRSIRFGRSWDPEVEAYRCECIGECGRECGHFKGGRCVNVHGEPSRATGAKVVLTVAHLDHTPENCEPANLRAMCQGCHLHYDRDHHAETARRTRHARHLAAGDLFPSD